MTDNRRGEPEATTFEKALADTADCTRYLLLGNGFSISARPSFSYPSLFRRGGPFSGPVAQLFREEATEDFERVLSVLRGKMEQPDVPASDVSEWKRQEDEVREGFIAALQRVHPDSSMRMAHEETERCITFLEHFVGRKLPQKRLGRVYTTNYDLLLYWAVARHGRRLTCYDAHFSPVDDKRYGIWDPQSVPGLVYLHGALHLYDRSDGGQLMLRYDGQRSLIEQARQHLSEGRFPVIVSEGTSEAKAARIRRSNYLQRATALWRAGLRDRSGVLFTYGHSLSDRDAHLIRLIGSGRIRAVYIGAYGGLGGGQGPTIRAWADTWRDARSAGKAPQLAVQVYDTKTFSPWA